MPRKLSRGDVVKIEFRDHVHGGSRPMSFVVYGRVGSISDSYVVVDCWHYKRRRRAGVYSVENETRFTIVRSAITKIARLVEESCREG